MAENSPKPQISWRQNVKKDTSKVVPRLQSFSENRNLKMDPKIVGYYSINQNCQYVGDTSCLKYIRYVPIHELPFDLNENFMNTGTFDQNQMFSNFLTFLKDDKAVLNVVKTQQFEEAPFVCTKSTLTHFFQPNKLTITACLSNNVIYLSAATESAPIPQWRVMNGQRASVWGLKFQQFMQTKEPGGEIDTEKPALGIEEFLCVFQSQLDEHTILYTGTVDGIRLQGKRPVEDKAGRASVLEMLNRADLVDLHTLMDNKRNNFWSQKMGRFWSQAYLAGMNNIVLGHRDKFGVLHSVEESSPTKIHRAVNNSWTPESCLKLCNRTLTAVKKALVEKAADMCLKHDLDTNKVPNIKMFFRLQGDNLVQITAGTEAFPNIDYDQLI